MKTSAPDTSRASRAIFTAASLIAATSPSRYCSASLRRFAPKVFVSMMSAPARMKPRCSESTLSGARMFASSGQRSRATALDTSVPMPPSPTSGGPSARRSRNRLTDALHHSSRRERPAVGQVAKSTHVGGSVKRPWVTPAAGESTRVRSLTAGNDAAAARVRSLRGEGAVPPRRSLPGTRERVLGGYPAPFPFSVQDRIR